MLAHRFRRWPNINPTLDQRHVFAGEEAGLDVVLSGDIGDIGIMLQYGEVVISKRCHVSGKIVSSCSLLIVVTEQ